MTDIMHINSAGLGIYCASYENIDITEFSTNEILLDSMLFRMIQISENARKLSDEYKQQCNNIPWNALYGLRNRIVHDYGNVDLRVVLTP